MPDWQTGLRKIAADQYVAGDSDPRKEAANWLRAVMGLKSQIEPTGPLPFDALRSADSVDVSAPELGKLARVPDLDRIYLGSKTAPPTGTYTPPAGAPPTVDPRIADLWRNVTDRYPFAGRFVKQVQYAPNLPADTQADYEAGRIRLGSYSDDNTLIHELTHAAAEQQFTDKDAELRNYFAHGGPRNYSDRRGERVAHAVARSADNRVIDESRDQMKARMDAAEAAWKAGKGPRPGWM